MEKAYEFAGTWFRMQRELLKEGNRIQRDFINASIDALGEMQESFLKAGISGRLPGRNAGEFLNEWFRMAVSSSRGLAAAITELQETFKSSVNEQAARIGAFASVAGPPR